MSKASQYNHFIKYKDGDYYGYNFLFRSMVRVPEGAYAEVLEVLRDPNSGDCSDENSEHGQWLSALRQAKFVVDGNINEINILKHFYYKNLYNSNELSLIILPTLHCNLDCPYCYEYKKPIFMNQESEDRLMAWVEKNFSAKRSIHVAWFGGEPLMGRETISKLSGRLKMFCDAHHIAYTAAITTNGVLVDESFIKTIPNINLRHIQITLDGNKSHHDQLRKTPEGKGSYDKIVDNLVNFCNLVPRDICRLTVRVNCSDKNVQSIRELLEDLPVEIKERATIFFRWIYDNDASSARGHHHFSSESQGTDSFAGLRELNDLAREMGYQAVDPYLSRNFNFCEVDFSDQYTIYPDGDVFMCNHSGHEKAVMFNLAEGITPDHINSRSLSQFAQWMMTGPFEDKKCLVCKLLPLCLGGCRKARFEGRPNCISGKSTIPFLLENAIEQKLAARNASTLN